MADETTDAGAQSSPLSLDFSSASFAAQDLEAIRKALTGINSAAGTMSSSLTRAFAGASTSARGFQTVLTGLMSSLGRSAASLGVNAVGSGLGAIASSLFGGGGDMGSVAPFADGGVVSSPTFFGSGGGVGLMGERGAEAILPLARGPNGQLGVAAGASGAATVNVTIQTQDAESFRQSQQQVSAALARAVARGQRSL